MNISGLITLFLIGIICVSTLTEAKRLRKRGWFSSDSSNRDRARERETNDRIDREREQKNRDRLNDRINDVCNHCGLSVDRDGQFGWSNRRGDFRITGTAGRNGVGLNLVKTFGKKK